MRLEMMEEEDDGGGERQEKKVDATAYIRATLHLSQTHVVTSLADLGRADGVPQRMLSYMSPSYIVQPQFDTSWTPSPSGTQQGGWVTRCVLYTILSSILTNQVALGSLVLFILRNAGSAHQIRSIVSSAA